VYSLIVLLVSKRSIIITYLYKYYYLRIVQAVTQSLNETSTTTVYNLFRNCSLRKAPPLLSLQLEVLTNLTIVCNISTLLYMGCLSFLAHALHTFICFSLCQQPKHIFLRDVSCILL
jgi:hypothetical protein